MHVFYKKEKLLDMLVKVRTTWIYVHIISSPYKLCYHVADG